MMMIPEPWERHTLMDEDKKAFYEFHACMMEPWDGPASITFSDGQQIGAVLDRNGLRPSRYYVTNDDLVIMASEVGVIPDLDPLTVVRKRPPAPGPHVPRGHAAKAASSPTRKSNSASVPPNPIRSGWTKTASSSANCPNPRPRKPSSRNASSNASSPSAIPTRTCACCWAPPPPPASSRSPRWAMTRRWPCCPQNRSFSISISSRSSPRSPTRRSTASARNSSPPPKPSSAPRATCSIPARTAAA